MRGRSLAALVLGSLGAAVGGGIAARWFAHADDAVIAYAAAVDFAAGLALVAYGLVSLVRVARGWRAVPVLLISSVGVVVLAWTVAPAVVATNVPPIALGGRAPVDAGLDAVTVTVETDDGVPLSAWWVASRNGAAVVLRHGSGSTRTAVLDQAAVLAGHGYGVLLVDARGRGRGGERTHRG